MFFASSCIAQSYGSFEWDIIRLAYVIPTADGTNGGVAIGSEPRYNINDNISASIRGELAFFGAEDELIDLGFSGSFTLFGDYNIQNNRNKRAFVGAGFGIFSGADVTLTVNGNESSSEGGSGVGIVPRIGYELGFLRISGEYNLIMTDDISNYFGINLGFTIGGRYKG